MRIIISVLLCAVVSSTGVLVAEESYSLEDAYQDSESFDQILTNVLTWGNTIEIVRSYLGPGHVLTDKESAGIRKTESPSSSFPFGVRKNDVFLAYHVDKSLPLQCLLQFRDGKLISHDKSFFVKLALDRDADKFWLWAECSSHSRTKNSWWLGVQTNGVAVLRSIREKEKKFLLNRKELEAFRDAVKEEGFWDYDDRYGDSVVGGSRRSITIRNKDRYKRVRILFVRNWLDRPHKQDKLSDALGCFRLWSILRGWFEHEDLADSRPYDLNLTKKILNPDGTSKKTKNTEPENRPDKE